ncbi:MAG: hypothetical protein Ct9H300mP6_16130 [Gammaproteobacteria bacterium]|nr:MAG: hypothetical protein Ct9H300mP6_16130 [Gammaproteobacteria bacterium]
MNLLRLIKKLTLTDFIKGSLVTLKAFFSKKGHCPIPEVKTPLSLALEVNWH